MEDLSVGSGVEIFIQLATTGGFGALSWYLIVKHLPKVEERRKEERNELFSEYKSVVEKSNNAIMEVKIVIVELRQTIKDVLKRIGKDD